MNMDRQTVSYFVGMNMDRQALVKWMKEKTTRVSNTLVCHVRYPHFHERNFFMYVSATPPFISFIPLKSRSLIQKDMVHPNITCLKAAHSLRSDQKL